MERVGSEVRQECPVVVCSCSPYLRGVLLLPILKRLPSLPSDPAGLQPMLPYLVPLLAQEVGCNLGNVQHLRLLLRWAAA